MSIVGVLSGEGYEVVIFNVLKDVDSMIGYEVVFLMDMGVECNLLFLDVYKGVIGDLDLNFFDIWVKLVWFWLMGMNNLSRVK